MTSRPSIAIVDDDPAVRKALGRFFEMEGFSAETFHTAKDFTARAGEDLPQCIILDLELPDLNGLQVQKWLMKQDATRSVIFVTGKADVPSSVQAMREGAVDFLEKPVDPETLLNAVRDALRKETELSREQSKRSGAEEALSKLTSRERDVFDGVVAGLMNKQIAANLGISIKTVKVHRGRMMKKLAAKSVPDLVEIAHAVK